MMFIQGQLISFAIRYVLRQVGRYHDQIDFQKVKADLEPKARAEMPGTWFDDEAVALMDWVIDTIAKTMVDDALSRLIASVLAGNWPGAAMALKAALVNSANTERLMSAVLAA